MALPFLLSLLGSGAAGAGILGTMSPLIAGSIGAGLGSAIETGDIGEGIKTGLTAGLLGGVGGALTGGLGSAATQAATTGAGTGASLGTATGQTAASTVQGGRGLMGMLQNMPSGLTSVANPTLTGSTIGQRLGQIGSASGQTAFGDVLRSGLQKGVMTGAGLGTAMGGMAMTQPPGFETPKRKEIPQAEPAERTMMTPPAGYRPGFDPEFSYFSPSIIGSQRFAEGGEINLADFAPMAQRMGLDLTAVRGTTAYPQMTGAAPGAAPGFAPEVVNYLPTPVEAEAEAEPKAEAAPAGPVPRWQQMGYESQGDFMANWGRAGGGLMEYTPAGMPPMRLQAGGLADMAGQAGAPVQQAPQMNEKQLVSQAIRAVRNELPEEAAAVVLAQFVQTFGEDALRRLVDDVQSGKADMAGGDMEGKIQGPGDGMDDLVPARMSEGNQDVLLSDGEFIVPADVVSGLGNGSSDAGADELLRMMDRVREERTGMREQPKAVAAGGLMPA